jgi:hypothetical protein
MPSVPTPDKLARLRSFLEHLERNPDPRDDADTIASLKDFLLTQIRALEIAQNLASQPNEPAKE